MEALGKNIIIQEVKEKLKKTTSGLLLGEKQREDIRYKKGIISLRGRDVEVVETNDIIYYDKHAGFKLELNDEVYTIIQEKDIVLVL